jgi:hypothetical protein
MLIEAAVWTLHVCRSNVKLQYAAMSMSQDDTRTMKHAGKWSKAYDARIRSLIGSGYQCFRVNPKSFTFSVSISTCNVAARYSDNEARQKMEEKCFAYGARNLQDCYITEGWRLDRPKTGSDRIQILLYSLLLRTSIHSDTIRILDTDAPTFFYLTLCVESIRPAPSLYYMVAILHHRWALLFIPFAFRMFGHTPLPASQKRQSS